MFDGFVTLSSSWRPHLRPFSGIKNFRLHAFFMLVCYLDVKRRWKGVGRLPGLSAEIISKQEISS